MSLFGFGIRIVLALCIEFGSALYLLYGIVSEVFGGSPLNLVKLISESTRA